MLKRKNCNNQTNIQLKKYFSEGEKNPIYFSSEKWRKAVLSFGFGVTSLIVPSSSVIVFKSAQSYMCFVDTVFNVFSLFLFCSYR